MTKAPSGVRWLETLAQSLLLLALVGLPVPIIYAARWADSLRANHVPQRHDGATLPVIYYDAPTVTTNLDSPDLRQIQVRVTLKFDEMAAIPTLESVMPDIVSNIAESLRAMKPEQVRDAAYLASWRKDRMRDINQRLPEPAVRDLLIKEMIVK